MIVGLAAALAVGGVIWAQGAWKSRQVRALLGEARQAFRDGREATGEALLDEASQIRGVPARAATELKGALVRRAFDVQLKAEKPVLTLDGPFRPFRELADEARRRRLPCPFWLEVLGSR